MLIKCCIVYSLFSYFLCTSAITATWRTGNKGDWYSASNWMEGVVPDTKQYDITINGYSQVTINKSVTINSISIGTVDFLIYESTFCAHVINLSDSSVMLNRSQIISVNSSSILMVTLASLIETWGNSSIGISTSGKINWNLHDTTEAITTIVVDNYATMTVWNTGVTATDVVVSVAGTITISPASTFTVDNLNLQGNLNGNGEKSIINVNNMVWYSGIITNVTIVSMNSTLNGSSLIIQDSSTFKSYGILNWVAGTLSCNPNNYFINFGYVKCYNNSGSGYFFGAYTEPQSVLENYGTIDCAHSSYAGIKIYYWDVISAGTWLGGIDNSPSGGSWWIYAGTVFDNSYPITYFGNEIYSIYIPYLEQVSFDGGSIQLFTNVTVNSLIMNGMTIFSNSNFYCKIQSNLSARGSLTFNDASFVIAPNAVAIYTGTSITMNGKSNFINWGMFTCTTSLIVDISGWFINIGWFHVNVGILTFDGKNNNNTVFVNTGTLYLDVPTEVAFYNSIKFLQCNNGEMEFRIDDPSNTPKFGFYNALNFNIDGSIRIFLPNSTIASQVTSIGMTLFRWTTVKNTTGSNYIMFTGTVSSTSNVSIDEICWNPSNGNGIAYLPTDWATHSCYYPIPSSMCSSELNNYYFSLLSPSNPTTTTPTPRTPTASTPPINIPTSPITPTAPPITPVSTPTAPPFTITPPSTNSTTVTPAPQPTPTTSSTPSSTTGGTNVPPRAPTVPATMPRTPTKPPTNTTNNITTPYPNPPPQSSPLVALSAFSAVPVVVIIIFVVRFKICNRKPNENNLLQPLPEDILWGFQFTQKGNVQHKGDFFLREFESNGKEYGIVHQLLCDRLDGKKLSVKAIYGVYSKQLLDMFVMYKQNLEKRFETATNLFQKQKWTEDDTSGLKQWSYDHYEKFFMSFPWNHKESIKIIPQVHGTDFTTALSICSTGFATLSVLDAGWYGQGVYFTSSAKYAIPYYSTKKEPSLIIAYVIAGNVLPVVEHPQAGKALIGKGIVPGYQAHYVVTKIDGYPVESPCERCFSELVIGQEAQIVPAFILKVQATSEMVEEYQREVVSIKGT